MIYTPEFQAYKDAVVIAFLEKKNLTEGHWLSRPTRARIRKQFLQLVKSELAGRDRETLCHWLEIDGSVANVETVLRGTDADDFKTLEQFLDNTLMNPAEDSLEMIAIVIDYPLRPFSKFKMALQNSIAVSIDKDAIINTAPEVKRIDTSDSDDTQEDPELLKPDEEINIKSVGKGSEQVSDTGILPEVSSIVYGSKNKWLLIGCGLAFVVGAIWWLSPEKNCMYWDNDHYIATSCNVSRVDTPLVRLDPTKLGGFRRLHHVDTLTYYSVDKLWYVRVGGIIEVYSAYGKHPLYPDKKLAPLTYYAVNVCQKQHGY